MNYKSYIHLIQSFFSNFLGRVSQESFVDWREVRKTQIEHQLHFWMVTVHGYQIGQSVENQREQISFRIALVHVNDQEFEVPF